MGVIGQHTRHQRLDGGDFLFRNRLWALSPSDDIDDADRLKHGHFLIEVKPDKTVAREQWHLYLFFPILPLAETLDRRQQRFNPLIHELVAHDLLMP